MNLIGKILTVVIFILSIMFMTMVLAVYATNKNWRDAVTTSPDQATAAKPLGLKYVYDDEKKHNQELKDQLGKLNEEKTKEFEAKVQALTKLENEYSLMKDQIKQLQQSIQNYDDAQRKAVEDLQAVQKDSAVSRGEVEGLRSEAEKAQSDRDAQFREVVKLTDEMHQLLNEMTVLKSRNTTLSADLAKAQEAK